MRNKKITFKIFSYLIILAIFFFLGRNLINNWQRVKEYDFSFNYFYLLISFLFLFSGMISFGLVWNKILRFLEPSQKIPNFKAVKIYIYSWFGKYLPGKAWLFLGRIYLGQREGLSKKTLILGTAYEIVLSIVSALLFSLVFLGLSFGVEFYNFYIIPLLIIPVVLFLIHPRFLNFVFNLFLRKFKKMEMFSGNFLSYQNIIIIIFYFFIVYSLTGLGFFFLVKSLVFSPFYGIIGMMGLFIFASVLGMLAIFAPSGLGVREGILVAFLQFYFPLTIAILISLMARIWAGLGEVIIFSAIYLYSKFRKI